VKDVIMSVTSNVLTTGISSTGVIVAPSSLLQLKRDTKTIKTIVLSLYFLLGKQLRHKGIKKNRE
tara:strand:+ start:423 stop:617 length:195 start_codon:yes stop_codon:yes gene_type:complete